MATRLEAEVEKPKHWPTLPTTAGMTVPLHILGRLCGWNFSRWDAECHVLWEPAFPESVQDCPVWMLMLAAMLLQLWGSHRKKRWSKDGLGTASLVLSSLGLYDICPHVNRISIGVSVWVRS